MVLEARPKVMPGNTSGDMKKLSATRASLARLRARPSEASVARIRIGNRRCMRAARREV